jgi:glycosyltransferase involved in cell wall biosynthesis
VKIVQVIDARTLSLVSAFGLRDCVEFRSPSFSEMPALYNEADVVVYPTTGEEPYGLVPLEAMSCGRPIVAAHSGGITETVVDGETGYVVERGDVDALSERTAIFLEDPGLARRFGVAGRALVEREFHIGHYIAALIEDYKTGPPPAAS